MAQYVVLTRNKERNCIICADGPMNAEDADRYAEALEKDFAARGLAKQFEAGVEVLTQPCWPKEAK